MTTALEPKPLDHIYQCPDCHAKLGGASGEGGWQYFSPRSSLLSGMPMMQGPYCATCHDTRAAMWDECCRVGATNRVWTTIDLKNTLRASSRADGSGVYVVQFRVGQWSLERAFFAKTIPEAVRRAVRMARDKGLRFRKPPATMLVKDFIGGKVRGVRTMAST